MPRPKVTVPTTPLVMQEDQQIHFPVTKGLTNFGCRWPLQDCATMERKGKKFIFLSMIACCNQVKLSAAAQSRIVTRSYFGAAAASAARRRSIIRSTKLFRPGEFPSLLSVADPLAVGL